MHLPDGTRVYLLNHFGYLVVSAFSRQPEQRFDPGHRLLCFFSFGEQRGLRCGQLKFKAERADGGTRNQ